MTHADLHKSGRSEKEANTSWSQKLLPILDGHGTLTTGSQTQVIRDSTFASSGGPPIPNAKQDKSDSICCLFIKALNSV